MAGRTLSEAEFTRIKQAVLDEAPPNLSEADWQRYATVALAGAIAEAEHSPAPLEGSAVGRFAAGAWQHLNPVTMATGLYEAFKTPEATGQMLRNVVNAQVGEGKKAVDLVRQGRYTEAAGHAGAAALPLLGPAAAAAGERVATGDLAGGIGEGVGLTGSIVAPGAVATGAQRLGSLPIVPRLGTANPAVTEAVAFGLREGIPVDVATATGNRFLRGVQRLAEGSLLGSGVGATARAAQAEALTQTGERLATRTHPLAVTAEQAGQAVCQTVTRLAEAYNAAADAA